MLGCSFADDFRTLTTIAANMGTDTGAGNTADRGLTTTGAGYISYDIVAQPTIFTAVIRFSAAAVSAEGILFGNVNLTSGAPADGFCIWVTSTSIKATFSNGVAIETALSVDFDYADGEIHTVAYAVDMGANGHALAVDSMDTLVQGVTSINEVIGEATPILVAGDGTDNFTGTIEKVRLLDAWTEQGDFEAYIDGTIESFFTAPLAAYRCDSYNDDTTGHYIWDRTTNQNDLAKADRATPAEYPTLGSTPTAYYIFDGVDDYASGLMTLPAAYTITAAKSAAGYATATAYPEIQQDNDETFTDLLTVSGAYSGYLHSLAIHSGELSPLQLLHDEYIHLYWLWRGRANGAYMRLITEGTCQLAMFCDYVTDPFEDFAREVQGVGTNVTEDGRNGCTFGAANSNIEFPDAAALRSDGLTLFVFGTFTGAEAAGTIIDKGVNYKFLTNGNQLDFNGSTIAHTFDNNYSIAVTVKDGFKPRFYVDYAYIGEGTTVENPDDTDTTALIVGNNNEKNSPTQYAIKQVYIGNAPLTGHEIRALHESAQTINIATIL